MALFYAFDEYTDVEDENATRNMADILMDGLKNPEKARPLNECPLGELARQYVLFSQSNYYERLRKT